MGALAISNFGLRSRKTKHGVCCKRCSCYPHFFSPPCFSSVPASLVRPFLCCSCSTLDISDSFGASPYNVSQGRHALLDSNTPEVCLAGLRESLVVPVGTLELRPRIPLKYTSLWLHSPEFLPADGYHRCSAHCNRLLCIDFTATWHWPPLEADSATSTAAPDACYCAQTGTGIAGLQNKALPQYPSQTQQDA